MNSKKDPMGRAIADYFKNKKASKLRVFSPMFEEDEIPLITLFRNYESMPEIERKVLDMAKGRVLDVGAGAGCHSLVLQEKGMDVTAIHPDADEWYRHCGNLGTNARVLQAARQNSGSWRSSLV